MFSFFNKSKLIRIHDVFLNFRGEDTRRNFVSHLYAALSNAGVNTFLDDEKLQKGNQLGPELLRAIEGSQICVVVFSKSYAQSSWCLNELVKIEECRRQTDQTILPVFYDVDASDVRRQKGEFAECSRGTGYISFDQVSKWNEALTRVANMSGWDVKNYRSESQVVMEIVDAILKILEHQYLPITKFPVGLESRVQDLIKFFKRHSKSVCIIGIWGMGGVGKTTIAKAIYNKTHREFEVRSFLANIREVWEKDRGQIDLQEQLLSDILKTTKLNIHSIEWGKNMIKERLCKKRAFVVLDDVNKFEQLDTLCGNCKWLCPGSVVNVTTKDVHLLKVLKVGYVYETKEMDEKESLELFSWHSFKDARPRKEFIELSKEVVAYCGGLPLALEVLGSYLCDRTTKEWKSVLSKLQRIPNNQIQKKLRISFDGLEDHMEKNIFLDICCFFVGKDRAFVTEILNGCELHADIGITVLIERSLIKVEKNNKLGMHALLRDMGREIVCESSREEPEKRSRLWFHKDVLKVLTENTGTNAIEGLALKLQRKSKICFSTNAFENMKSIRLLQLDYVQLVGNFEYLSKHLSWVSWQGCPLKYTPDNFYQGNAIAIELKRSNLKQVWKKPQLLESLKILNLSHSIYLTNTPDFSFTPNLERLILKDCRGLSNLHESIGKLCNLFLLNLTDCTSLGNLPRMIYKLKSLKTLILSGCSKIDKLEEDIVQMESLTTLIADNTAVTQVPFFIVKSKSIAYISLCGYEGLTRDIFPLLISSWMSPTMNPIAPIPSLGTMSLSPAFMELQNSNLDDLSPVLSNLLELRSVSVQCHSEYQLTQQLRRILDDAYDANFSDLETPTNVSASQLLEYSLESLLIGMGKYHEVLSALNNSISKGLTTNGSSEFSMLSDSHAFWLSYTGEGQSVLFEVPNVADCCMKGMTLCVFYSSTPESVAVECLIAVLIVNHTRLTFQIYRRGTIVTFNDEDWQRIISNLGLGDKVEIVILGHGLSVKKTTVYLIYDESSNLEMEPSPEPKENASICCQLSTIYDLACKRIPLFFATCCACLLKGKDQ